MGYVTPIFHTAEETRKLNALFFAPPGTGKTRLIGTAQDDPRTSPMVLVDFEGGTSTLAGKDIKILTVRDWGDFWNMIAYLRSGDHPFKSVGVDSISESHIFALLRQLDTPGKSRRIDDLLEQGDYGIALVQMRRLLRAFRDLPIHFMATAMVKEGIDPMIGTVYKPSLVGALADEAPGIFDVVGYLATTQIPDEANIQQLHRVLVLQNYPQYRTKVRTPEGLQAPNQIIDPTIGSLLDALNLKTPVSAPEVQ